MEVPSASNVVFFLAFLAEFFLIAVAGDPGYLYSQKHAWLTRRTLTSSSIFRFTYRHGVKGVSASPTASMLLFISTSHVSAVTSASSFSSLHIKALGLRGSAAKVNSSSSAPSVDADGSKSEPSDETKRF